MTMVEVTKFRNVVAHTYGLSIDHDAVDNALGDPHRYRMFVVEIRSCLESIDTLGEGGGTDGGVSQPAARTGLGPTQGSHLSERRSFRS